MASRVKPRNLFLALFILAVVLLLIPFSAHRAAKGSSDFDVYYYAGKALLNGAPIYSVDGKAATLSQSPFLYPPFFACVISPFSFFSIATAAGLWNILNFLFMVGSGIVLTRSFFYSLNGLFRQSFRLIALRITFLLFIILICLDNLAMAQINPAVFFFLVFAFECVLRKKDTAAGISLAGAIAMKLIPLIFLPYFILKQKWRLVTSCLVSLICFFWLFPSLSVGFQKNLEYYDAFQRSVEGQRTPVKLPFYASQLSPSHQNLQSVLFRLSIDWDFREHTGGPNGRAFVFRTPIRFSEKTASEIAIASVILLLIAGFYLISRSRMNDSQCLQEISFVLILMFLSAPKMRSHGFIYLVFPLMYLAEQCLSKNKNTKTIQKIFFMSAFFYLLQGIKYFKFLGAGCFSALILLVYFGKELMNQEKRT